jgi:D-alanyl-lipoteichoic acid acyltransferase DltB (MBOAT superfamily)
MIFSSVPFIFAFLPIALVGYFLLAKLGRGFAAGWLIAASLVFYAYWSPIYLLLLVGSVVWNFAMGQWIFRFGEDSSKCKLVILWIAIGGDLALLGYYKYLFPLIGFLSAHGLAPAGWETQIALPLGISFFTFTQIGYLVDSYDGQAKERGLLSYVLFVTFFPHLIAGPILHHREIMPQFANRNVFKFNLENLTVGIAIFTFGITKKVLLADPLGFAADAGFKNPTVLGTGGAWLTALSYSLQLYFDFSGYSDMAIGLARMFGVIFPANFNSPYKAVSIIDYWARWHMTLTRYLTLYLYNPLGLRVSRSRIRRGLSVSGEGTRNLPAFITMVIWPTFFTMSLAGFWHGAGLQFLVFGLLHAGYLCINHAWRSFRPRSRGNTWLGIAASVLITYIAVLIAQVFFRAGSISNAISVISAMIGHAGGVMTPSDEFTVARIVAGFAICLVLPNTQQIMLNYRPILDRVSPPRWPSLLWQPSFMSGVALGIMLLISLLRMSDVSKFLYFQF